MPNHPPTLLLSESESASSLDRRALRDAGFPNAQVMTSGIEAAKLLASGAGGAGGPAIVVCSQKLADMDGEQFCAIIRQHPGLRSLPVLLLMPNDSEAGQLEAMGCGASAILGRPYSVESLRKKLLALAGGARAQSATGPHEWDTGAFEKALASYGLLLRPDREPEDYFRAGKTCLEERRWNVAIGAFQQALRDERLKAEAELGIAAACKGKGDIARFRAWLGRASETLVEARRWHLARTSFARLLQHEPEAKNPFLAEARRLVAREEYGAAAETLIQGLAVLPKARTGEKFAAICFGADKPQAMFASLAEALGREGDNEYLSAEIRQSLDNLLKEREDRQKMLAAERKWQLSRQMAEKEKRARESAAAPSPQPGGGGQKNVKEKLAAKSAPMVMGLDAETDPEPRSGPAEDMDLEDAADDADAAGPALAPLAPHEATTDMFSRQPKFNEFLSVVKLTLKLAKRTRKKGR